MRTIKKIGFALLMTVFVMCEGCKTNNARLETGGDYAPGVAVVENGVTNVVAVSAPDMAFFAVDSTFDLAYSTIQTVFATERRNRLLLWRLNPQIKRTLDKLRPQVNKVIADYDKVRLVYIDNPTPAGLTQMQTMLSQLQNLSIAVSAAMPNVTTVK